MNVFMAEVLTAVGATAPDTFSYSWHSLRHAAASSVYLRAYFVLARCGRRNCIERLGVASQLGRSELFEHERVDVGRCVGERGRQYLFAPCTLRKSL